MSTALPPEMVSDVLCRLPVKSLLRFRCISKPFCSLIDSPDFAKLHLNQTSSNKSLILTNWKSCSLFSVELPSLDRAVEIEHPFKTLKGNTKLFGSCNGLLCLLNSDSEGEIVLWNMSTRKHHRLPHIHTIFPIPNQAGKITSLRIAYGFGYDSVHDDYKLVRIVQFHNTLDGEVMVYSLKSNSWKKKLCGFPYDLLHKRSAGLFAEGALHWMVNHPFIAPFDLATEEHREIPLPLGEEPFERFWRVFDGRLSVTCNRIAKVAEIWMLKHNDSSWTKWISISDPQATSPQFILPIAYMGNGNELLLLQDTDKFLSYDLKTNKVKNVRIRGMPSSFDAITYVETLVNPLPMINVAAGKHKNKKNGARRDDFLSKGFKLVL